MIAIDYFVWTAELFCTGSSGDLERNAGHVSTRLKQSRTMSHAIAILQNDPVSAERLAAAMKTVAAFVKTVGTVAELRKLASPGTIGIGVLDLDVVPLPEVTRLRQ